MPTVDSSEISQEQSVPEGRDLREYLRDILKRKRLVISIWLSVFAAVGVWTARQPNEYEAATVIEYDPNPTQPLGSNIEGFDNSGAIFWMSQEFYETQNQIITSHAVAERTVRRLALHQDRGFIYGEKNKNKGQVISIESAADILQSKIRIEMIEGTRLVRVIVTDQNPSRAQAIANSTVDSYTQKTLDDRLQSTVEALNWLNTQLEDAQTDLHNSEIALHTFKQNHNVLSVSMEDRQNTVTSQIEGFTGALTQARSKRIELSARVRELRNAASQDPMNVHVTVVEQNPEVQQLRTAYRQKQVEKAAFASRYGENHPTMQSVQLELETLEQSLRSTTDGILRAANADLREIESVEGGLRHILEDINREGLELNLQEIEYQRLSRERENNTKLYTLLLERTAEANLARLLHVTNVRLVDPALKPYAPVRPRKFLNMAGGCVAGLMLGIIIAVIIGLLDRTIKSAQDLEALGIPVIGILPLALDLSPGSNVKVKRRRNREATTPAFAPELYVYEHPRSVLAESCRTIRTNLAFMGAAGELKTLLISSVGPSEGKTTTSMSIAIATAQSGVRTIIVDTDLRKPRIHKILNISPERGITSVLINEAKLDECIHETMIPGLYVLPCGPIPPNPSELLHTERFAKLVEELRQKFQRVIFDSPPVGIVTDGVIIAPQVDGILWVARAGVAHRDGVMRATKQIRHVGGRLVGAVINALNPEERSYDSAYYYQRSGYYAEVQPEASSTTNT